MSTVSKKKKKIIKKVKKKVVKSLERGIKYTGESIAKSKGII